MNPPLNDKLLARYPLIFAEHFSPGSAMSRGVECGDGWFDLIDALCALLQRQTDYGNQPQAIAAQVKEKLGGLRFYLRNASERQRGMIDMAQELSFRICDQCGSPGSLIQESWLKTRCELHRS
ncbi:MAG: hypothetical protein WBP11_12470 [Dokdonella sp.]